MTNSWGLYDRLLAEIPEDRLVESYLIGSGWTLVDAGGLGVAMTCRDECCEGGGMRASATGRSLRALAESVRSWSLSEASLGMAAMNAHYNIAHRIEEWTGRSLAQLAAPMAFHSLRSDVVGKKVGVIGHFPELEVLSDICELSVFERRTQPGDLPDFAEEYLLPEQDYLFITGVTLINKTLPRILQLARDACVVMVGPSVPLTPILFEWGVDVLAGTIVADRDGVWRTTAEAGVHGIWKHGAVAVQITADDYARRIGSKLYPQEASSAQGEYL
ncbi:MAG: DUF364 domain-containing protein [Coriobacteriia bacterium]|nr:DUF364 domain-containing protein [Coriobacteriia bacterium]